MNDRSYYMPKTFYINFRYGVLGENGIPRPSEMPVFLHEVSHLVQDQSTISAVINFIFFLDRVQDLRNLIKTGANTLPFRSHDNAKTMWSAVLDDFELLCFASKPWPDRSVPWAFERYEIVQKRLQLLGEERLYPVAIAHFVDNVSNTTMEQPIGIKEIKEAYAVAVERLHGALEPDLFSTEFQYVALERILAQFGEVSPRQTIAICHWALQGIFPGARFFELVEELNSKLQGSSLGCDEEWFDILRQYSISDFKARRIEVEQALEKNIAHYEKGAQDDPLAVTLRWYKGVIQQRFDDVESLSRRFPINTFLATCRIIPQDKITRIAA